MPDGLVPPGDSGEFSAPPLDSDGCQQSLVLLGLRTHHSNFCLQLHLHYPFSVYICVSVFSSYKDTSLTGSAPILETSS